MNNAALAISMAMQSIQLVQQIQSVLAQAANDGGRDLTDEELNSISSQYKDVHSKVDEFLAQAGK